MHPILKLAGLFFGSLGVIALLMLIGAVSPFLGLLASLAVAWGIWRWPHIKARFHAAIDHCKNLL